MGAYFDLSGGSGAAIFEIETTNWDRAKHRQRLLNAHRRQVANYVNQFIMHKREVSTYVHSPSIPAGPRVLEFFEKWRVTWMMWQSRFTSSKMR